MHLYILAKAVSIDISDITLEAGCTPVIGSNRDFDGVKGVNLEPAIWFKVLVIDAISIDCTSRQVSWSSVSGVTLDFKNGDSGISTCSTDESALFDQSQRLTRSISDFDCGECYTYDLDEVFDTVPDLVSKYKANIIDREELHQRLMQVLHVHVLPSIKLGCEDIDNVTRCLKLQDVLLQEVDKKILAMSENIEKRRKDKKEQRGKFISEILNSSSKQQTYGKKFVAALLDDVVADVAEAWDTFEKAQRAVDRFKVLPPDEVDEEQLEKQRILRSRLLQEYETLLAVREKLREFQQQRDSMDAFDTLKNRIKSTFKHPVDNHEITRCQVYLMLTKGEDEKVAEIRRLTDKKLLMLSVKETMRSTLDELLKGEETFGVDKDTTGSQNATNVLNSLAASTPWQTLAEQVAKVLANMEHELAKLHLKFCSEVNGRCTRVLEEGTIRHRSSSQTTLCIRGSGNSDSSERSSSSGSGIIEISVGRNAVQVESQPSAAGTNEPTSSCNRTENAQQIRDSAVSENSRSSRISTNSTAAPNEISEITKSHRHSGVSLASDNSAGSEHGQGRGVRKEKSKSKRALKSMKSTFQSYLSREPPALDFDERHELSDTGQLEKDERSNSKKEIDVLMSLINLHFSSVCQKLQQELKMTNDRYFRKIWLCYESHFYQETIDGLVQLYQLEYDRITEALHESVKTLTVTDLLLDDALLSHMLQDVKEVQAESQFERTSSFRLKSDSVKQKTTSENPLFKLLRKPRQTQKDEQLNQSVKSHERPSDSESCGDVDASKEGDATSDPSVSALRRRLSVLPRRPTTVRLSLNIQYPNMGVIVYERTVCPIRNMALVEATTPTEASPSPSDGSVASAQFGLCPPSDLPEDEQCLCKSKLMLMKPKYKKQFALAFQYIDAVVKTRCPSAKFQLLTRCIREVSNQISNFYQELYDRSVRACSDELMDALVILLCNVDGAVLSQLYCQIMLLADILPNFLTGSPYSFTLVQFVGACQFIQDRILLKKHRNSS